MNRPTPRERRNVCLNRRARFEFELFETYEAGLMLLGSEVKSLRQGKGTLEDAWVGFGDDGRPVLMGAHIAPYPQANQQNHEPTRPRPMLMNREEIRRLKQRVKEKGLTLVPTQMYFQGPWIKVEFAVGRGKKLHDKRHSIREREDTREAQRAVRGR
ncbi:MAG: SsrA-binding protein SmpB [Myxococcota bacterium]